MFGPWPLGGVLSAWVHRKSVQMAYAARIRRTMLSIATKNYMALHGEYPPDWMMSDELIRMYDRPWRRTKIPPSRG